MKVLIVNQYTENHGDEAAGKALVRNLISVDQVDRITIYYHGFAQESSIFKFDTDKEIINIDFTTKSTMSLGSKLNWITTFLLFVFPPKLTRRFLPKSLIGKEIKLIMDHDLVISAPTGPNIGLYRDLNYLFRIYTALRLNKKVAVYSISIGPFPAKDLFYRVSLSCLKKVDFLALRDRQSQQLAESFKIKYHPAIDTAFLG